MLQRLNSRELSEWYLWWLIEPWSERRADTRTAIIAQILAEVNRDRKRRSNPFKLEDFMAIQPLQKKKKVMSWQTMKAMLKAVSKEIRYK